MCVSVSLSLCVCLSVCLSLFPLLSVCLSLLSLTVFPPFSPCLSLYLSLSLSLCLCPSLCVPPLSVSAPSLSLPLECTYLTSTRPLSRGSNSRIDQLSLPRQRIDILKTSIAFCGTFLWNVLPLTVRSCHSLTSFKQKIRVHMIITYEITYDGL